MEFGKFITFLFLIYETSFYLVTGQSTKSDCTKLYNFLKKDSKDYSNSCCENVQGVNCDKDGYITHLSLTKMKYDFTSFPSFSKLEELIMEDCGIEKIPDGVLKSTTLKTLSIYNNALNIIPSEIKNLSQLERLKIHKNNVKELPLELFSLKNLNLLDLDKNMIETIPSDIKNLSQLQELHLSNNSIKAIPPEINNLSQLNKLDIGYNNLKELPNELFNLKELTMLVLYNNTIEEIPPAIKNLSKLELLYLGVNNLEKLPNEIFSLTNLNKFDIGDNPNLNTKIIKFGNSVIKECYFSNINVSCYEPNTCETIHLKTEKLTNLEAESRYGQCTQEEICPEPIEKDGSNSSTVICIILGCIVVILVGVLVAFMLMKKRKFNHHQQQQQQQQNNESDSNIYNDFPVISIKELKEKNENSSFSNIDITAINMNKNNDNNSNVIAGVNNNNNDNDSNNVIAEVKPNNNNINNNNNNVIVEVNANNNNNDNDSNNIITEVNADNNNSNNDNNNVNDNNSINNNNNNNTQNNLNQSIVINSDVYNTSPLPVGVILTNDPQNPGQYIMNSVPIFINNTINNQLEPFDMQKHLELYDKNNLTMGIDENNKPLFYCQPDFDKDEPPPEYSETDISDYSGIEISKRELKQQFM